MNEIDAKTRATAILAAIKKAGINLIASLPDINVLDLIDALERDAEVEHVPLCREEEGIGICAGARLVGRKPALIMQNAGLLNSCNGIVLPAYNSSFRCSSLFTLPVTLGTGFCQGWNRHDPRAGGPRCASLRAAQRGRNRMDLQECLDIG
jgi:sulfopyruvate decarboxylase TPP-binding subunit